MPETFPVVTESGELRETVHHSLDEVAALFHMHKATASRLMREHRWPHMKLAHRVWFSDADLAAIVASLRANDGPDVPEGEPGPLGLVLPPDDDAGPIR